VSDSKSLIYQYLTATVQTNLLDKDGTSPERMVVTLSDEADQTQKILMHLSAMEPSILNCYILH
jgi:hypothetical protein